MEVEGARSFKATGTDYDRFMGRYSRALAGPFADAAGVTVGQRAIDVGCGPGALTGELVDRLGAGSVSAVDPSPSFVAVCAQRYPGVDVRFGQAEALPFDDACQDVVLAQLVLHFVSDPVVAAAEMRRVVRPGGVVAACAWDFASEMEMLRLFWDAALAVDPDAPDDARTLSFGREGEIVDLFEQVGLQDVAKGTIRVRSTYRDFDELWSGFLAGIGPAGAYCVSLASGPQAEVRREFATRVAADGAPFTMSALARWVSARTPS